MQYYAKVNTASPATGFITVGEVLTEKQAAALGEEKLNELVRDNVLGVCADEAGPSPTPEPDGTDGDESAASEAGEDDEGGEETDEELPELEMTPDMVSDQAVEAPAPKAGRRRKAK